VAASAVARAVQRPAGANHPHAAAASLGGHACGGTAERRRVPLGGSGGVQQPRTRMAARGGGAAEGGGRVVGLAAERHAECPFIVSKYIREGGRGRLRWPSHCGAGGARRPPLGGSWLVAQSFRWARLVPQMGQGVANGWHAAHADPSGATAQRWEGTVLSSRRSRRRHGHPAGARPARTRRAGPSHRWPSACHAHRRP